MKRANKKFALRAVLSIGNLFQSSRLEVMVLDANNKDLSAHYRVNPNLPYSPLPVVDEVTMQIVGRIFEIMSSKHGLIPPMLFVAGHIKNGYPVYYTLTYGSIHSRATSRLLEVVSRDILKDYRTPSAVAYIRKLIRDTRCSTEIIKRVLNAWAIANLILEEERHTLVSLDEASGVEYRHSTPVSLL